jgi:hypothetical protein
MAVSNNNQTDEIIKLLKIFIGTYQCCGSVSILCTGSIWIRI